jgi:outer membrane protein OmpA-like peptidoglycan-associated protein
MTRNIIFVYIVLLLVSCSKRIMHTEEIKNKPRSICWSLQDWRFCDEEQRPTPKTIDIIDSRTKQTTSTSTSFPIVIYYDTGKSTPIGDWEQKLKSLQISPEDRITIKAYTDIVGTERYNDNLARKRGEFVLAWLRNRGIKNTVEIQAKGKCCYVSPNNTASGRASNRRAEIYIERR